MYTACRYCWLYPHLTLSEWAYQGFKVSWDLPPSGHLIELDN